MEQAELLSKFQGLLEAALAPIREDMQSMKTQLTFISDLQQETAQLKERVAELEGKMENIEKQDNAELGKRVNHLEKRVSEMEQYTRRNNLLFNNIPEVVGETPLETVQRISEAMKLQITKVDIDACHRLPSKTRSSSRPFLVKFVQRTRKTEVLVKAKQARCRQDVFGGDQNVPIFVNEHLTGPTMQILNLARQLKDKGYRVETRDCVVFVRKGAERRIKITTEEQIKRMLNTTG